MLNIDKTFIHVHGGSLPEYKGSTTFYYSILKREDLQPIFSFKNRGSYNKIVNLSEKQKSQGIIAASAGNHAQGVALACKKLNISCNIIMPVTAAENKLNSVRSVSHLVEKSVNKKNVIFKKGDKVIKLNFNKKKD